MRKGHQPRKVRMTEKAIRTLPPPDGGKFKVQWTDAGCTGLKLIVSASGRKGWEFRYSWRGHKRVPSFRVGSRERRTLASISSMSSRTIH